MVSKVTSPSHSDTDSGQGSPGGQLALRVHEKASVFTHPPKKHFKAGIIAGQSHQDQFWSSVFRDWSCAKFCPPFILFVEGGERWKSITDLFHCGQFSGNKGALTFGDCAHFSCLEFQVMIWAVMSILQFEKPIRTLDLRACSAVQFDYSHDRINCFWWVTSPCEQSGAKWVRRKLWYTS